VKEKILESLKTKFKNLGFTEKTFDGVASYLAQTITEDTQLETGISGVESLMKAFQSDIDKRVTDAVAKAKAEATKPIEVIPPKVEPKPEDEVPAWAKGILARLEGYEKRETQASLISKIKTKLAEKKIPESYYRGRSLAVEKEADIDNIVSQIEEDHTAYRQDLVNSGVIISTPAEPGGDKADAAIGKRIAEQRNNPTAVAGVTGKKLI
jgi:hypothetical protein